uniref:Uncharacterized protein n=1 Tax=Micrurus spixii TaxID=129469 RepID=A0A2D4LHM5_9SAUR
MPSSLKSSFYFQLDARSSLAKKHQKTGRMSLWYEHNIAFCRYINIFFKLSVAVVQVGALLSPCRGTPVVSSQILCNTANQSVIFDTARPRYPTPNMAAAPTSLLCPSFSVSFLAGLVGRPRVLRTSFNLGYHPAP